MPGLATKDLLSWLPSLLTLGGWYLVNKQNNSREKRKEVRSAADKCKILARECAQLAIAYWLADNNSSGWQVKAALEELEVEVRRFPVGSGRAELNEKYTDFVDTITADDFDSLRRKARFPGDVIMKRMARTRQEFLHQVEIQFEKHYP